MTTEPLVIQTDEEAALTAVLEEEEDEALRIIGQMSPDRRHLLAMYAERLSTLAHYEGESR